MKKFLCIHPDHDDHTPSMNMHKSGNYIKCFSCNRSADIFTLCSWLEDKPVDGPDFVKENVCYLADKFEIKYQLAAKDDARNALKYAYLRAYKVVCDYIYVTSKENPTEEFEAEYSKKRRWPKTETLKQGLGCVHSFKDLMDVLYANGFTREFITLIGLNRPDMFNKDGFIFSIFDEYNRPVAFYTRDVRYEEKLEKYKASYDKLEAGRSKPPVKYNSTANYTGIYEKQLHPYGLHDCKNFHKVILVEGHGCRHSLRVKGVDNVLALGGTALGEETIKKLTKLGVTHLVLLLDNDSKGKEKLRGIIRQFYGKLSMDFSVLDMASIAPNVKDPDEFLRSYTIEQFKTMVEKDALDWLSRDLLSETNDPYSMLQEIIPYVALERSPIARLKIIGALAELTGIDRDTISSEVDQKISSSIDRQGEYAVRILDEAKEALLMNPSAIDGVMNMLETKFGAMSGGGVQDDDVFGENEFLKTLVDMQESEDKNESAPVILTGYTDFDKNVPMPTSEAFNLVVGPPNTGKSSLFISTAINMLELNEDLIVLMFTNDDSRNIYINRFIAALAGIKINWVKAPSKFLDEDLARRRNEAYKKVADWIRDGKLVIKDVEHGNSAEFIGKFLKYYRNKYPSKQIMTFADNFHRLVFATNEQAEGRHKFTAMSSLCKSYTTKYDCNLTVTVEMRKEGMYEKPTDSRSIAEAASLQFDANLILFLWNDLNVNREDAILKFEGSTLDHYPEMGGYVSRVVEKPVIEGLILKNKLSEFKGSVYWKFHPELAYFENCSSQEAEDIASINSSDEKSENIQNKKSRPISDKIRVMT